MKEYYYFQAGKSHDDLKYILRKLWRVGYEDNSIWKKKLSSDTHRIRVDAVESSLLKAIYR